MGETVVKKRFFEKIIINTDKKEKNRIVNKLIKQKFQIIKLGLMLRGRFKVDKNRIKIIAEREITKDNVVDGIKNQKGKI